MPNKPLDVVARWLTILAILGTCFIYVSNMNTAIALNTNNIDKHLVLSKNIEEKVNQIYNGLLENNIIVPIL